MQFELNDDEANFLETWIAYTIQEGARISNDLSGYKASSVVIGRDLTGGQDKKFLEDLFNNMMRLAEIGEKLKQQAA